MLILCASLLTGSGVNQDALVGSQVAEVEQHHVGGDVVDRQGGRLLEAHALWDEEGVARRCHHHLLPQPEAAQHHHLVADLPVRKERRSVNRGGNQLKTSEEHSSCFFSLLVPADGSGLPGNTRSPLVQLRLGQFALEGQTQGALERRCSLGNRGDLSEEKHQRSQKRPSGLFFCSSESQRFNFEPREEKKGKTEEFSINQTDNFPSFFPS